MTYKYSNPTYFTNTKDMTCYTCYSQGTRYGFRHIAFKGIVENPYSKNLITKDITIIEHGNVGNLRVYYPT